MSYPKPAMAYGPSGSMPIAVHGEDAAGTAASRRSDESLEAPRRARMRRPLGGLILIPPKPCPIAVHGGRRSPPLGRIAADAQQRLRHAEEALAEQRILTREADHRVANALQLIHGTLSLQAAAAPDSAREAILAAARSVAAAAQAHRHLYGATAARPCPETVPD